VTNVIDLPRTIATHRPDRQTITADELLARADQLRAAAIGEFAQIVKCLRAANAITAQLVDHFGTEADKAALRSKLAALDQRFDLVSSMLMTADADAIASPLPNPSSGDAWPGCDATQRPTQTRQG
jgi:hypothetical protein